MSPVAVVALLCVWIVQSLTPGPAMDAPSVGAGAGNPGGANAVGEIFGLGLARGADAAPEGDLVAPETLEQGFIVIVDDESDHARSDRPIHFASSANNWNPGDPGFVLSPRSDMRWQIVFEGGSLRPGTEFKFTLGSWASEELNDAGEPIENRTFPRVDAGALRAGERPVIELRVPQFRQETDGHPIASEYRPIEGIVGTLRRVHVAGGAGAASGRMRDLFVWLPPGYDDPENRDRRYPVLYMMDGQNLFDPTAGAAGSWEADRTAQRLIEAGEIPRLIIVGVPHAGVARIEEYLPPAPGAREIGAGRVASGDRFVAWLTGEVVPRVERAFRAETDPGARAIGGSSLGAAVALHAATHHPDVFGLILAESPATSLPGQDGVRWRLLDTLGEGVPERVYIATGAREMSFDGQEHERNAELVREAGELDAWLGQHGLRSGQRLFLVDPEGVHQEPHWARRFPDALRFLFAGERPAGDTGLAPPADQPADQEVELVRPETHDAGVLLIVDDQSRVATGNDPVHIATNHEGWNPGNPRGALTLRDDGRWEILLAPVEQPMPLEFKFALGSWERVELDGEDEHIPNRTLDRVDPRGLTPGEPHVVELTIPRFAYAEPPEPVQLTLDPDRELGVTGDVRRVRVRGGAGPASDLERDLLVWLPPGFERDREYPILYLLDGQHVFETLPYVGGEWEADETATRLIEGGEIEPLIIVGVPHAGRHRADEYLHLPGTQGVQPSGSEFDLWFTGEVMPAVEQRFPASRDGARTAIGGSSLGAVAAIRIATADPDRFGMLLVESLPGLVAAGDAYERELASIRAWPARVHLGVGGREASAYEGDEPVNRRYVEWAEWLSERIAAAGVEVRGLNLAIAPEAHHDEGAWAERLPDALRFLFPPAGR